MTKNEIREELLTRYKNVCTLVAEYSANMMVIRNNCEKNGEAYSNDPTWNILRGKRLQTIHERNWLDSMLIDMGVDLGTLSDIKENARWEADARAE